MLTVLQFIFYLQKKKISQKNRKVITDKIVLEMRNFMSAFQDKLLLLEIKVTKNN